ncbi:low molecular weight protein-tyrosine-phosphatase [Rhizobium sp. YIM 134829]|uniref:low molecular weight protein-tyrosine-phosphatase n=1 Tax=Rhizobium sp. YIM 134829 TaxID=3390453 RepID=UPI003979CB99
MTAPERRILFVCLGNICRSPMAEGIARHLAEQADCAQPLQFDSAGTGRWHLGDPPDPRAIATAARKGVDIAALRGRQVAAQDFARFDLILALDRSNLAALRAKAPAGAKARLALFLEETLGRAEDVPDPYFGAEDGFETVYTMLFEGCSALIEKLGPGGSCSEKTSSVR